MSSERVMRLCAPLSAICFVLCAHPAIAQPTGQFKAADTSSPRDTLRSFIEATNELHDLIQSTRGIDRRSRKGRLITTRIRDCIDASGLPAFVRDVGVNETAAALKEILDRVTIPPWEEIPDNAEIQAAGGFEKLSRWRIPDTRITIERVEEGPQKHEYLFSTGTVQRAVEYYQEVDDRPYRTSGPRTSPGLYRWFVSVPGHPVLAAAVERLPESMRFGRTLGLANWKWPGVLFLFLFGMAAMWGLYSLWLSVGKPASPRSRLAYFLTLLFPIAAMLVPLAFVAIAERYLTVRGMPLYVIRFSSYMVTTVAAVVTVFAVARTVSESIIVSPKISTYGLSAQVIRISSNLVAIVVALAVLIAGGQYLGIPIATLLASAGIGGIALALGAQDTLKNIFATVTLLADEPLRVGERINFGPYRGIVEDIGLRSTKLRLLDGHVAIISNYDIAAKDIENISRRKRIRVSAAIGMPMDTPYAKVETAMAIIREKLTDHEGMEQEFPPECFFEGFGAEVLSIRFTYWYSPPDELACQAFGEKLYLEILRAFEAESIALVQKSRH